MTQTYTIQQTYLAACDADRAFQTALEANAFKSRWDWKPLNGQIVSAIETAYRAKVAADAAHSAAWAKAGVR